MGDLPSLVVPLKSIAVFPGWSEPEPGSGYTWFNAPLEIGGVVEPGLVLHGGALSKIPDQHISLELRLSKTPGRRIRPLERIDWRSISGGHSNPRRKDAPAGLSGRRTTNTHLHAFDMNWSADLGRMRHEDLPYADDIAEEIATFEDLLRFAGKRFKINNMNLVLTPPWEYTLGL